MRLASLLVLAILAASCAAAGSAESVGTLVEPESIGTGYPPPPEVPVGEVDPSIDAELAAFLAGAREGSFSTEAIDRIGATGDPRAAWALADLMRFIQLDETAIHLQRAFARLTGVNLEESFGAAFVPAFNHLIAWDLPAWPGYVDFKRDLYAGAEPEWGRFFDENVSIDWRLVYWGGVLIDNRPPGSSDTCPRGCIPALEDPETVSAAEGDWYPDEAIVFGLEVNGEALALPKNQMQVHEMVNMTLGGTRLGIPYCTLCGSAQAYVTDAMPQGFETAVLRTSGLLSRSNKMMFDLNTRSVFDTFTGRALSGELAEIGFVLDQVSVVSSTWGRWKEDHPDTRIIAQDGGIDRVYDDDPLGGRDDNGPIFPTGPVDPRLPVMEPVVGVIDADGIPIAFPVETTRAVLEAGEPLVVNDLTVSLSGDGLLVTGSAGEVGSHEAFWFAWSQFHPETLVWSPLD